MKTGSYYIELQGATTTFPCKVIYEYVAPKTLYDAPHVAIIAVRRLSDDKCIRHIIPRYIGDSDYYDKLSREILEHIQERVIDYDPFDEGS